MGCPISRRIASQFSRLAVSAAMDSRRTAAAPAFGFQDSCFFGSRNSSESITISVP